VRFGAILEGARAELEQRGVRRGWRARLRRFLLQSVVAVPRRLRFAFRLGRAAERIGLRALAARLRLLPLALAAMPPIPPARQRRPLYGTWPAHGRERGRVALFTGCVMEQWFGATNRRTLELLRHNGFTVDVPRAQVCCGALLLHDGLPEPARALARRNLAAFAGAGAVVVNAAGCGAALKEYGELIGDDAAEFAARVCDVTELLDARGLVARPAAFAKRVAYDDPCHLCHAQRVRQPPRRLLAQVPGLELVAHPSAEDCCGSAGIYNLLQPELAGAIGARKAAALLATGADVVVTGNPGCMLQIAGCLREAGRPLPVLHPVDLLLPEAAR
jgi:Fe-S oxidoreductase